MTLAYILGEFPSISETFILREILALRQKGLDVNLFSLHEPSQDRAHAACAPLVGITTYPRSAMAILLALIRATPVQLRPAHHSGQGGVLRRLRDLVIASDFSRHARAIGVRHVHAHFAFQPASVARLMAARLNVPWSVSLHARDIFTQPPGILAERIAGAAFVAVCSEIGRQHVAKACPHLSPDQILLARHGTPLPPLPCPPAPQPVILGIGRLEEKKGFRHLVDACAQLKARGRPFRCILVGDGSLRADLESRIAEGGLRDVVSLAGELTQEELATLYRTAQVVVVPSIRTADGDIDGIPNVILEAFSFGIPVVASSIGGIPEAVTDAVTGYLVAPGSPGDLAGRMEMLLADASLRGRMGKAGYSRVVQDFDISRNAEPLAERFRRSMNQTA